MAKTCAERQRACRQRLKDSGGIVAHREQDKVRKRNARLNLRRTKRGRDRLQADNRRYKQSERQRAKAGPGTARHAANVEEWLAKESVFRTRQHKGKCMKRVKEALPRSPRKQKELIVDLAKEHGLVLKHAPLPVVDSNVCPQVPAHIQRAVVKHFEEDSISLQSPARRDCRTVQVNGTVMNVPVRYMTMTVKEAYSLFLEEHSDMKIGKTSFHLLRPAHVFLQEDTPHNVCTCIIHENLKFLLKSLYTKGVPICTDFTAFISQVVCDQSSPECMQSGCTDCPGLSFLNLSDQLANEECQWSKWVSDQGRSTIHSQSGSVLECVPLLQSSLPKFFNHTYVKREQSKAFKDAKNNLESKQVVIQVDYAENYTYKYQDEIQSAHWNRNLLSIFTAVAWLRSPAEDVEAKSFAFVSDCSEHNKYTVHVALQTLLGELMTTHPHLEEFSFFSDGAASQFKQRFTLCNLTHLASEFGVSMEWSFFESYHGKGAVDAIGGAVKHMVWKAAKSGSRVICAANFVEICKKKSDKITTLEITMETVNEWKTFLDNRWKDAKAVPNTLTVHYV